MNLVVKSAFGDYKVGQNITDQSVITKILESANARHVLKVADLPVNPAPVNPFTDLIKDVTSSGLNSTLSAVSSVSSGLSNTNSSVSSISSGLSDVSTGLSNTNSSISSVSSSLSNTSSSVSSVSTGLSQ